MLKGKTPLTICFLLAAVFLDAKNHRREIFEIDLMTDACVGRNKTEIIKGSLAPAQERVALDVAFELDFGVFVKCVRRAEKIHLDRVVND